MTVALILLGAACYFACVVPLGRHLRNQRRRYTRVDLPPDAPSHVRRINRPHDR